MQKIGIDCRLAGSKHAGIGRYIESLVTRIVKDKKYDWILFFFNKNQAEEVLGLDSLNELPVNLKIVITPVAHYSLKEQLDLPIIFQKEKLSLLHVPHFNIPLNYRGKMIVTIHDLLWHEQRGSSVTTLPFWKYWIKYASYKLITKRAVRKAGVILVPAKTVAETLANYYPKIKSKIIVTKEGISEIYKKEIGKTPKPLLKRKKQFVYTGSLYPHKNLKLVIEALKNLPEYKLILVGSRNIFQKQTRKIVKNHGVEKQVEFAGFVPDLDLIKIYQESFALSLPSLSEGFGLPGVEAMAAGLPVLASDIKIFREIYQKAPIYFDPNSVESFLLAVNTLEKQYDKQLKLGREVTKQYNWDKTTKETLGSYEKLL